MRSIIVATTALLLGLAGPAGVLAQPGPHGDAPGRGARGMGPAMLHERLDLSAEQQKQMDRLRLEHQKKMQQVHSKLAELRLEREALFLADTPDRQAVERVTRTIGELTAQQQMNRIGHWFAVNDILTPAQKEVWKEMGERGPGRPRGRGCGMGSRFHGGMRE